MLANYSKIHNLGHPMISGLLDGPVLVEEKVDGSQFSFGVRGGELKCRSRGAELNVAEPDKMFALGVHTVKDRVVELREGWTYRGEYLQKPKHNTLAYDRIPTRFIAIFDIDTGDQCFLDQEAKREEAERLGFECVPALFEGEVKSADDVRGFLERTSFLGGQKIEGVVLKNYAKFTPDGKAMMGKFVSEAFKEIHRSDWKDRNPGQGDIRDQLIARYKTPARWNKAIQHLAEAGKLDNSPRDIGELIKEIQRDVLDECGDEIKEFMYSWVKAHVQRGVCAGFAEYYKQKLLEQQFDV